SQAIESEEKDRSRLGGRQPRPRTLQCHVAPSRSACLSALRLDLPGTTTPGNSRTPVRPVQLPQPDDQPHRPGNLSAYPEGRGPLEADLAKTRSLKHTVAQPSGESCRRSIALRQAGKRRPGFLRTYPRGRLRGERRN